MRSTALFAAIMSLLVASPVATAGAAPPASRPAWNGRPLIVRGKLAAVHVEPVLYRRPDVPRGFFVAIWIRNLSDKPIGVDGPGERWFIHPNQWGASDEAARSVVDERALLPQKLDDARRAELKRRMKAGTLTVLAPGASLESHVQFDGSGPEEVRKAVGKNFILSFDGQVLVTDGRDCESLAAKADGMTAADLVLPTPVRWEQEPLPSAK